MATLGAGCNFQFFCINLALFFVEENKHLGAPYGNKNETFRKELFGEKYIHINAWLQKRKKTLDEVTS